MARKGNILCQKSKHKKSQKAPKDFLKDKVQIGKKKKPAVNDTKTDYKVAQIQMPAQGALSEKGEEVTQRGLTLQDLLAHVGHHSAKVREDAFRGLHELCSAHEGLLSTSLARILDAEAMIAIDSSAAVREAFRKFQAWLIEALPLGSFEAFASTLAIQVRSALSHVSSEIRDDGLLLLELYVSQKSGMQVLNQAESIRIVQTLCQQKTQPDLVLRCLYRLLLRPPEQEQLQDPTSHNMLGTLRAASSDLQHRGSKCPRLSLQSALSARALSNSSDGNTEDPANMTPSSGDSPVDSPIWEFCLRSWLQAGELPRTASGRGAAAQGGPGWIQMRCAAVMEHALEAAALEATDITYAQSVMALRPSAAQLSTLVGVVRRGEWPLQVDSANSFRALADSVNLRMARVLALLASGGAPADTPRTQLTRLACAALNFLDSFSSLSSSSLAHSEAISGAAFDPCADVEIMQGAAAVAFALGSLDLLWATSKETCGVQAADALRAGRGPALGPEHSVQLVTITARFASGGAEEGGEMSTASAILAAPLAASLLGLRLRSSALNTPSSVRPAWPSALISCEGACFAEVVERSCPGAALTWVSMWPKLLWYLGDSDPLLSAFLLSLVLDLAKLASRAGGLHEKLLGRTCSLLLPFMVGRPGREEEAPPLALLPRGLAGAQGLAAAVLPHFPKISDALVVALTRLICQWSDLGLSGDHLPMKAAGKKQKIIGLGVDCCELILESLLTSGGKAEPRSIPTRLRVAFTVLCAHPPSRTTTADAAAQSETAALRLADALAGWLMSLHIHEQSAFPGMPALSYDDRRRLALQSLAWPLCKEGLPVAPSLAPRLLCFLFFCAARLPDNDIEINDAQRNDKAADLGWRDFLCLLFDSFLSVDLITPGGANMAVCTSPLCDPARGKVRGPAGAQSHTNLLSKGLENDSNHLRWVSLRRLGQLFVTVWMKAVPAPQKPAAYELLIKLCAGKLAGLPVADSQQSAWQIMSVLIGAIAHRNEVTLPTSSWGSEGSDSAPSLKTLGPGAIRADITMQLQRLSIVAEKRDELKAMLPLL